MAAGGMSAAAAAMAMHGGDDLAPMISSKEVVEDKGVPLRM
jgi:hypothetical protein